MLNPPVTIPVTFVDGQTLFATQLNQDFAALLSWVNNNGRSALATNLPFYVAPNGIDAPGNGLSPTSPAASGSYIYQLLLTQYSWLSANAVVTIQYAPGIYGPQRFNGLIPGQTSPGNLVIQGNVEAPDTTVVSGDPAFFVGHGALALIQGFAVNGASDGIYCGQNGIVGFQAIDFGNCGQSHIHTNRNGIAQAIGNYTVSGGGGAHWFAQGPAHIFITLGDPEHTPLNPGPIVTLTGTPAFGTFALVGGPAIVSCQFASFVGSATGVRYNITDNGVVYTGTSGALVLPGSSPGTVSNGGVYD